MHTFWIFLIIFKLSRIYWAPLYYMQFAFTVFQFCNFKLQIVFCFCNLQFGCNLRLQLQFWSICKDSHAICFLFLQSWQFAICFLQITRRKNGCKYYMQLQIRLFQKILQLSFYGRYILYAAVRLHIPFFCKKEGSY